VTKHKENGNRSMGLITVTTPTLSTSFQSPFSKKKFSVTKRFNNPYKDPTFNQRGNVVTKLDLIVKPIGI
jgi:hypothetical protein